MSITVYKQQLYNLYTVQIWDTLKLDNGKQIIEACVFSNICIITNNYKLITVFLLQMFHWNFKMFIQFFESKFIFEMIKHSRPY